MPTQGFKKVKQVKQAAPPSKPRAIPSNKVSPSPILIVSYLKNKTNNKIRPFFILKEKRSFGKFFRLLN